MDEPKPLAPSTAGYALPISKTVYGRLRRAKGWAITKRNWKWPDTLLSLVVAVLTTILTIATGTQVLVTLAAGVGVFVIGALLTYAAFAVYGWHNAPPELHNEAAQKFASVLAEVNGTIDELRATVATRDERIAALTTPKVVVADAVDVADRAEHGEGRWLHLAVTIPQGSVASVERCHGDLVEFRLEAALDNDLLSSGQAIPLGWGGWRGRTGQTIFEITVDEVPSLLGVFRTVAPSENKFGVTFAPSGTAEWLRGPGTYRAIVAIRSKAVPGPRMYVDLRLVYRGKNDLTAAILDRSTQRLTLSTHAALPTTPPSSPQTQPLCPTRASTE